MKITILHPSKSKELPESSPCAFRGAMIEGLKHIGAEVDIRADIRQVETKHVACWGWRNGHKLRSAGHEVLVLERGYIGDRFLYTSLGWNGLNNYAAFPSYPDDGGKRFAAHGGVIEPWKSDGDYILILGQVPGDASLRGRSLQGWYSERAEQAAKIHQLPVIFRPHPEAVKRRRVVRVRGATLSTGTLHDDMAGAFCTISYNSNSCVDSVLSGVPCIAGDRGTMAWEVCSRDDSEIIRPERTAWAHALAWKQWTAGEIAAGIPLRKLIEEAPGA